MRARTKTVRIAAGLATTPSEAAGAVAAELRDAEVDLAFVFLSPQHLAEAEEAVAAVNDELAPRNLVGCVAQGVIAGSRELEEGPGVAVWGASLPNAEIETFHAVAFSLDDEGLGVAGFPDLEETPSLVAMLVDPFTFPAAPFLTALTEEHPGLPVVGGIASGAGVPGAQALVIGDRVVDEGAVGAVLSGVPVRTLVSQGCSPIGREAVITAAEDNVVYELAGEPALERLRGDLESITTEQRQLVAQGGLLAGLVIDENRSEYRRGDFLIRGVVGLDEEAGAIAVGEPVRVGQTLRFHVRDAGSADEDLYEGLRLALAGERSAGALLFTCNGRGTNMFSEPDHDARAVAEAIGGRPLAGLFCGGEIGPVGGRAFLHGFTATLALFLE
ncbi:MAG: FIST N-terminal domain-containing protein [Gaiellaceae bacterium]